MKKNDLISIVIPVKNGEATIEKCLAGIFCQSIKDIEVIIIDSGSNDNTLEILKKFPVRLFNIDPKDFNHGATRNIGVSHSKGEYVVMTVQDAWTEDIHWLSKMVRHFDDPEVVGVCGGQAVPHLLELNPHEWNRPQSKPSSKKIMFKDGFSSLDGQVQHSFCKWDNVNAAYRREALIDVPFQKVDFGEDTIWAKEILSLGKGLVYDNSAYLFHYHSTDFDYQFKRSLVVLYFTYVNFGYLKKIDVSLSLYFKIIYRNFKYKAALYWIPYNFSKVFARLYAYYVIRKSIQKGEEGLYDMYKKYLSRVPQGSYKVSKHG